MAVVDRFAWVLTNGVGWGGAIATELALLPSTIRRLREGVVALALLPAEIERLNVALENATGSLEAHLPELSRVVVQDLGPTVGSLDARVDHLDAQVEHLDGAITELSGTLTAALGSIPGVRRSMKAG